MKIDWLRRPSLSFIVLCAVSWNLVEAPVAMREVSRGEATTSPPRAARAERDRSDPLQDSRIEKRAETHQRDARSGLPSRPVVSLSAAARQYNFHLDQTIELLEQWKVEKARAREKVHGLLEGKQLELRSARDLLEEKFNTIRAALIAAKAPDQLSELDDFLAEFRRDHGAVAEDLAIVTDPVTLRNRTEVVERLSGKLKNRKRAASDRTKGPSAARDPNHTNRDPQRQVDNWSQRPSGLPNETIRFDLQPPARESTISPAYRGGGAEIEAADLDPTPDVQLTPEIIAKANELGNSPTRIYEFVRNHTTFEPYFGSLKGSQATFETLAGNDYDLASLLIALLRAAGIPSRYVRGTVKISTDRIQNWLGVRHPDAVNALLNTAGISAVPVDLGGNGTTDWFVVDRVWVEARVPHARYRGVEGSSGSEVWVPFDPAFKLRRYQQGIPGIPGQVPFDQDGYLLQRTGLLTYQWYQNQVREWLALNLEDQGLADIPYAGSIEPESLGLLPASLPHEAIAFTGEWTELPESLRHRFQVTLIGPSGTVLDRPGLRTVETSLSRITIAYATTGMSARLAEALGDVNEVPAFLTTLTPQLKIDGVVDVAGSTVGAGDSIDIQVRYFFPNDNPIDTITHPARSAGDYHALVFDLHQASETLIGRKSRILIEAIADVGTPGEDADSLTGELLSLAGMRYWQRVWQGDRAISDIYQYKTMKQLFEILASSNTTVEYLYDRPFAVTPGSLGVDSARQNKGRVGIDQDQSERVGIQMLEGRNGSAQEHAIWEEIVHIDSVSSIKALQFANETNLNGDGTPGNGDVLVLDTPGQTSLLCGSFPSDPLFGGPRESIEAALVRGDVVTTPYCDFVMNQWHGVGWIEENPATGAGAYLISGFLAGGETTHPADRELALAIAPETARERLSCAEKEGAVVVSLHGAADAGRVDRLGLPPALAALLTGDLLGGWAIRVARVPLTCHGGGYYAVSTGRSGLSRGYWVSIIRGGSGTEDPPPPVPDSPGGPDAPDDPNGSSGDPVSLPTGALNQTSVDFDLPGRTLPFRFIRSYSSQSDYDGPLGYGWTHNYNMHLSENADGSVELFDEDGGIQLFTRNPDDTYTPPPGNHSELEKMPDTTWTLTGKHRSVWTFDVSGALTSIQDRNGNTQILSYTGANLTTISDVFGRPITLDYTPENRLERVTDVLNRTLVFGYDAFGDLTSVQDRAGGLWTMEYFQGSYNAHNLKRLESPLGDASEYLYYANDKTFRVLSADGRTMTFVYQPLRQHTDVVDSRGFEWGYDYDLNGDIVRIAEPGGNAWTFSFDADRNQIGVVEQDGVTIQRTFDSVGNKITEVIPGIGTMGWAYDSSFNLPTSITDRRGKVTSIGVDPVNGNMTQVGYAAGGVVDLSYQPGGDPAVLMTSAGTVQYGYATGVYLTSIIDPAGKTTVFSFDAAGRPVSKVDPLNHQETYVHSDLDDLLNVTNDRGDTFSYERDALGRATAFVDPLGSRVERSYNALGLPIEEIDREGGVTRWEYDGPGAAPQGDQPTSMTNALGETSRFEYDFQGRLIRAVDPAGAVVHYVYDARGELGSVITPNSDVITFSYDAAGRRVGEDDGISLTTFQYDANGNLATASNDTSTLTFTYDDDDRMITAHDSLTGRTLAYGWDDQDRRTSIDLSGAGTLLYRYDPRGLLSEVEGAGFGLTELDWDDARRLAQITHPNGVVTNFVYDEVDRNTSLEHRDPSNAVLARFDTAHDARGRRTSMTDLDGTHIYSYDRDDRVLGATHPLIPDERYTYDAAGRRTSGAFGTSSIYGDGSRLLTDGVRSYEYDAAGKIVNRESPAGSLSLGYDPRGRVTSMVLPDGRSLSHRYDPFGRKVERNLDGAITRYLYDGASVLAKFDAGGSLQAWRMRGDGLDGLLAVQKDGTVYRYHLDPIGSVALLTDSSGAAVQSYRYTVFGARVEESNPSFSDPYGFTGRPIDPDTGLYDYRWRFYDPEAGRFLSRDPLGNVNGPDPYRYVRNNPLNLVDPFGLGSIRRRPLGSALPYVGTAALLGTVLGPGLGTVGGLVALRYGPLHHAHIFYDDGTNEGFMSDGKVRPDDGPAWAKARYRDVVTGLDDDLLKRAANELRDQFEEDGYNWFYDKYSPGNSKNCQDFTDSVLDRYRELERERDRRQQEERTKPEAK
jgi:RHS repeat-associated protein